MRKPTILILDDDQDASGDARRLLEARGHSVLEASDRQSGLAKVREVKPDLLILGSKLGSACGSAGASLPAEIRQEPSIAYIPILLTSARSTGRPWRRPSPDAERGDLPIDGLMGSPSNPGRLYMHVDRLLRMRTSRWAAQFSE